MATMGNPLIDPALQAHIDLDRAIKEHGGSITEISHREGEGVYMKRDGSIFNSASIYTDAIRFLIEFKEELVYGAAAFLFAARPIIIKWLEIKAGRGFDIKEGDLSLSIKGANDIDKGILAFEKLRSGTTTDKKTDHV